MGIMGTYLFIPFILLFTGFFVFLFYPIIKQEREETRKREARKTRSEQPQREESADDKV